MVLKRTLCALAVGTSAGLLTMSPAAADEAPINTESLCAYSGGDFISEDELFVAPCVWADPTSDTPWLETYVVVVQPDPLLGVSHGVEAGKFGGYTYVAGWVCIHSGGTVPAGECVVSVQENY